MDGSFRGNLGEVFIRCNNALTLGFAFRGNGVFQPYSLEGKKNIAEDDMKFVPFHIFHENCQKMSTC